MRIAVVHDEIPADAPPDQRDSLVQVACVSAALRRLGHHATATPFGMDLEQTASRIHNAGIDLVFNLVESVRGCGRLLYLAPALFDSLQIPYTGGPTESLFLTTGKTLAKRMLRAEGLPTPDWSTTDARDGDPGGVFRPGRYIVKSVWEEASVGLNDACVFDAARPVDLVQAIKRHSADQGGAAFAERYIDGREFNLSILGGPDGPQVLPPAEMLFVDYPADKPRIVNYAAKWDETAFEFHHTPRRFEFANADRPLLAELSELALRCWNLFGVRGYARVDFRIDREGRPWILEMNVNPCIAPDSGFIAAAAAADLSFDDVIERILADVPHDRDGCVGGPPFNRTCSITPPVCSTD